MNEPEYHFSRDVLGEPAGGHIMEIALTKSDRGVYVCLRRCEFGKDIWKISYLNACLTKDGTWRGEGLPSSRSEEFLEATRFRMYEALRLQG